MARYWHLQLRTDERVCNVVRHFERRAGWTIVREIDSANYGEGYDLLFGSVPVRLYDDQRSDEVMRRIARHAERTEWEREITEVARDMAGTVWLQFEIDRWNEATPEDRERAVENLRQSLLESGYGSGDVRVESG